MCLSFKAVLIRIDDLDFADSTLRPQNYHNNQRITLKTKQALAAITALGRTTNYLDTILERRIVDTAIPKHCLGQLHRPS